MRDLVSRLRALERPARQEQQLVKERFAELTEKALRRNRVGSLMRDEQERYLDRAEHEIAEERDARLRDVEARIRPRLRTPERGRALREHVEALAERHEVTVVLDPTCDYNARAFVKDRRISLPVVLEGDNPYATAMHEIGHILSPCEGPTHFRARRTYACIQCEIDAWRKGMALALVWTEGMHDWLRSSLATYARSTVGVLGTLDELHRLSSGHGYREERLRRMLADHERQVQAVTAARWHHD